MVPSYFLYIVYFFQYISFSFNTALFTPSLMLASRKAIPGLWVSHKRFCCLTFSKDSEEKEAPGQFIWFEEHVKQRQSSPINYSVISRCSANFCRTLPALQKTHRTNELSDWTKLQPGDSIFLKNTSYPSSLNWRQSSKTQAVIWSTQSCLSQLPLRAVGRRKAKGFMRRYNVICTFPYTCCLCCTDPLSNPAGCLL